MNASTQHPIMETVSRLLPSIAERAAEMESARLVSADLCSALETAGCFTMGVPRHL